MSDTSFRRLFQGIALATTLAAAGVAAPHTAFAQTAGSSGAAQGTGDAGMSGAADQFRRDREGDVGRRRGRGRGRRGRLRRQDGDEADGERQGPAEQGGGAAQACEVLGP